MPVPAVEQPKRTKLVKIIKTAEHDLFTYQPQNLMEGRVYVVVQENPVEIINDNGVSWLLGNGHRGIWWNWWIINTPIIGV